MATFLLLFVGRPGAPEAPGEQTAEFNQRWRDYMGGLAMAGQLRAGAPLESSGSVVSTAGNRLPSNTE